MRKLLFFLLLCSAFYGRGQDLIVTQSNDSIPCKITKVKYDMIYFTYIENNEPRPTLLREADVVFYAYDYYAKTDGKQFKYTLPKPYSRLVIGVSAGYSYALGKIDEDADDITKAHAEKVKSGYHLGANLVYYVTEPMGFGIKYTVFRSQHTTQNVLFIDNNGWTQQGNMTDNISTHFIGVSLQTRYLRMKGNQGLTSGLYIGHYEYRNKATYLDDFELIGRSFGIGAGIGYDWQVSTHFTFGLNSDLFIGSMSSVHINDGTQTDIFALPAGQRLNLGHFDVGVALKWNW